MAECEKYMEIISAMLDGEASADETREAMEHIAVCPECRAFYEDMLALSAEMSAAEPLAGMHESIMDAVRANAEDNRSVRQIAAEGAAMAKRSPTLVRLRRWGYAAAACVVVAVGIFAAAESGALTGRSGASDTSAAVSHSTSTSTTTSAAADEEWVEPETAEMAEDAAEDTQLLDAGDAAAGAAADDYSYSIGTDDAASAETEEAAEAAESRAAETDLTVTVSDMEMMFDDATSETLLEALEAAEYVDALPSEAVCTVRYNGAVLSVAAQEGALYCADDQGSAWLCVGSAAEFEELTGITLD
ncbi:MAG: zf-HC2 domain-containing protein [Oscillospiraceae bacterium]|nr:zf-HC2 domain-containing protein [Oscillospiraceae bacterium]